jgi:transcription antitermination factor NusG
VTNFASSIVGVIDYVYKLVDTTVLTKSGKKITKKVSVFPGYFFVNIEESKEKDVHYLLLEHPYVKRHVGGLSAEESLELNKIKSDDNYSKKFTETFMEGDTVKILEGLFKDYEATVIAVKSGEVVIETDLSGKPVRYSARPKEISFLRRG